MLRSVVICCPCYWRDKIMGVEISGARNMHEQVDEIYVKEDVVENLQDPFGCPVRDSISVILI